MNKIDLLDWGTVDKLKSGSFEIDQNYEINELSINKDSILDNQLSKLSDKYWIIIIGEGELIYDKKYIQKLTRGSMIKLDRYLDYSIHAITDMVIAEVQSGTILK